MITHDVSKTFNTGTPLRHDQEKRNFKEYKAFSHRRTGSMSQLNFESPGNKKQPKRLHQQMIETPKLHMNYPLFYLFLNKFCANYYG